MNTSKTQPITTYCCSNCPSYYDMGDDLNLQTNIENERRIGQCRRNDPIGDYRWPKVWHLDSCGQHPNGSRSRTQDLLALIAYRLESTEDRAQRNMRVPDAKVAC